MNKITLFMATALVVAACGESKVKVPALDLTNLDTTVTPAEDFYRYATKGWQDKNPLKPEDSRHGAFDVLRDLNEERINELFQSMASMKCTPGSVEQKVSDLYKMGLDSLRLNNEGNAPILPLVAEIQAIDSKDAFTAELAKLGNGGLDFYFSSFVMADLANSDMQILYLSQSGLGMGDRDYYLQATNAELKAGYKEFLTKIFTLTGIGNAEAKAESVVAFEDKIAEISWTREQERDYSALYNPCSSSELSAKYPELGFDAYFAGRNIPAQEKLIVCEPSYFEGLNALVASTDIEVLKDYLLGHVISDACAAIGDDYYAASWEFFSHQMTGVQAQKPRWKRAMSVPNSILGEAVGKMYVAKYFPESSKQKMLTLVENLTKALDSHIDSLDWMGDETKVKAHDKLNNFHVKIGYPDKWKDYSTLDINPEKSYYENLAAASTWYVADNMSRLGQPTDKEEWGMTPQTVNAYYNPSTNEICFPAAILQPPFFNADADDAVNYGAIGVVIGHEMSHGFDDQGRLFDKNGNMTDWWTAEDDAKFREKAQVLVEQFNKVEILPGLMANGQYTLGENIGDHGGLSVAYTAMENAISGKNVGLIDGFTPAQRFYLSYATVWAQNITDEAKRRLTNIDVHSLAVNRVNVSLKNFQTFFDAFGIKEGDPMYLPENERVHIW